MSEAQSEGYLSIGEVLGFLLEEFPDVTISKIRFLESQGLISPERTSSGYRKFYEDDVDLLKVILTEQRQNYLPLRVIKDRLKTGEIDPTGEHLRPDDGEEPDHDEELTDVPQESLAGHPAARSAVTPIEPAGAPAGAGPDEPVPEPVETTVSATESQSSDARLLPGVLLDRGELCSMVGMSDGELEQLESFGIVSPRDGLGAELYGDDAVIIARPACEFLRAGVDARHLRNWRTSAEREASLYEQLVTPRFRQRDPEARAAALKQLGYLDELGATLRAAMTRQALRHNFES